MTRIAQVVVPSFPHHVVQRGARRVEALGEVFGLVSDESSRPLAEGQEKEMRYSVPGNPGKETCSFARAEGYTIN